MKVGVLTLPLTENYGGILQAVALCRFLEIHGHEVVLLQKPASKIPQALKPTLKSAVWWLLLRIPFHNFRNTRTIRKKRQDSVKRKALHRPFIEGSFRKISPALYTTNDLRDFAEQQHFEAVIVGSDQVWRKQYINDRYYQSYFLDFTDGKTCRKIAYAASFGKDHWEGHGDEEHIGKLLADFTAVSTREQSGVRICQDTFRYPDAMNLLDPTLLLARDFYVSQIVEKHVSGDFENPELLTYVLDEEKSKAAIIQWAIKATKSSNTMHLKGFDTSGHIYSVPEWLAGFQRANFIVTDSFHGMAFSILFEKNFIAIGNKDRGIERFTSLLSQLGLEDRLVFSDHDLKPDLFTAIDYARVNKALQPLREQAMKFLTDALSEKHT